MFHSFNIYISSKIVGAEFFKSLKNLFFKTRFFKNSLKYTFHDLLKVCKVLKKFTEANTRKMDTKYPQILISISTRDNSRVILYFKNSTTRGPYMLFKWCVLHSYFHAWMKLGQLTGENSKNSREPP